MSVLLQRLIAAVLLLVTALAGVSCSRSRASDSTRDQPSVSDLTGVPTRVVWVQGEGSDLRTLSTSLTLMGYDTEDGRGERALLGERRNYTKPLITPRGDRIIFTDRQALDLYVVNWDGTGLRRLADGFGLEVWQDRASGVEWVYAARGPENDEQYRRVVRFPIDRPAETELVWDKTLVGEEFQPSADGRVASGLFPWPDVGIAELPNGPLRILGRGCWPALARLDPPLFWYFDGPHRGVTIVNTAEADQRWHVSISQLPGFDGAEVYFPRWTNDPRFLTMAGPYNLGTEDDTKVRLGGPQVEIYLGRFSADFSHVDRWAQVTSNDRGDSYPDVWIDAGSTATRAGPSGVPPGAWSRAGPADARARRVVLDVRLAAPVAIPSPRAILPYRHAMAVHHYDVVRVVEGSYSERTVPVAHWVIRDGRILSDARRLVGTAYRVTVEPYDAHPELEGERLVMSGDEPALPIYYDVGS